MACGVECIMCTALTSLLVALMIFMSASTMSGSPYPEFHIISAELSPFNMNETSFLADCNMSILLTNSNKKDDGGIYLSGVEGYLKYGEDSHLVAKAPLPNFYQDKLSETVFPIRFMASSHDEEDISLRILTDRVSRRVLRFDLEVVFLVKFNRKLSRFLHSGERKLADCSKFQFEFSAKGNDRSYGTMIGGARQCKIFSAACFYCRPNCGKGC